MCEQFNSLLYRMCPPVAQEDQVTQADHLLHFPRLSPGPRLALEGPCDPARPVRHKAS